MLFPDKTMAILMAKLSHEIYIETELKKGDLLLELQVHGFGHDMITGLDSYILSDNEKIIIVVKGTEANKFNDLMTNLNLNTKSVKIFNLFKEVGVHRGYLDSFQALKQTHSGILTNLLKESPRPIYLTGHSLGGSVASLYALSLAESHGRENVHLFTFGAPKIGDKRLRKLFDTNMKYCYRFANTSDIVPDLFLHLKHPCPALYLNLNGTIDVKDNLLFSSLLLFIILLFSSEEGKNTALTAHNRLNYIKLIENSNL